MKKSKDLFIKKKKKASLLKKSTSILSNCFNTTAEFFPISWIHFALSKELTLFKNLSQNQRNLLNNELQNVCRSYSLDFNNVNVDREFDEPLKRNHLYYLMMIKKEYPELYPSFIEVFFKKTWESGRQMDKGYLFFKESLNLGVPFKVVDDLVSKTENEKNKVEYILNFNKLCNLKCHNFPVTNFQFPDDPGKEITIDSMMKLVLLHDRIEKDPLNLEKIIEEYCKC